MLYGKRRDIQRIFEYYSEIGKVFFVIYFLNLTPPDVTERLTQINPTLARETRKVLDTNKSERHIRGGMATREKYLHQHG